MVKLLVALTPEESEARTLNDQFPGVDVVPVIWPAPVSESPGGSVPDATAQLYGGVPPEALNC